MALKDIVKRFAAGGHEMRDASGTYTPDYITHRIADEDRRKREIDAAAQSGNIAELQRLSQESATGDGKNYASLLLSRLTGQAPIYGPTGDGSFDVNNAVGGVIRKAAPLASFIPGVGPVAAGVLAAAANTYGQSMQGENPNLKEALLTGVATGGASALRGVGNAPGATGKSLEGLSKFGGAASSGGGGVLGTLGGLGNSVLDYIKQDPARAVKLGLGAYGAVQSAKTQGRANDMMDRALAPVFSGGVNPYANVGADAGNPYSANARRTGQRVLRSELSR